MSVLVLVSALDLEALRDVESGVTNGDEADPRAYVCTWQTQAHQDALVALALRIETAVLGGAPTCPHSFLLALPGIVTAGHDARFSCEKCGTPGMDTRSGRIVAVQVVS